MPYDDVRFTHVASAIFSNWIHWNRRSSLNERQGPGVYILARFEENPPESVNTSDERILLIAETHNQTLEGRWKQFHYSAFKGGDGHAGGRTFHALFANGPDSEVPHWLYLSASSVPPGVKDIQDYVQGFKNHLLTEYDNRNGIFPRCNLKGPSESRASTTEASTSSDAASYVKGNEPAVAFSPWHKWPIRAQVDGCECAGVYVLARFDGAPPSTVDLTDEHIVYIGETCDNSLYGRLQQFNRSAFLGKSGHSGGWSYSARCADAGDHLYASIFPVSEILEPHRSAFIRHIERNLLWQYVQWRGRRPLCNSK